MTAKKAAKDNLIKLVQTLVESPEDEVKFCVNNKFKWPNEVLAAKRNSPKKQLHFEPHRFLSYLEGILNFPADYISITKNVPFDRLVKKEDKDDGYDNEMEQRKIEVFTSSIHGKGLRILEDVSQKHVFIMNFLGEIVSNEELDRRGNKNYAFSFTPDDTLLDAYYFGNEARFLNHSCEPNCYSEIYYRQDGFANLGIFSAKAILREEELTIKYLEGIECGCPRCKRGRE